jgi:DNA replication protein DnaC
MMSDPNINDLLSGVGLRVTPEALAALITHATKSKLGPLQVIEQLALVERRERDAKNLEQRVKTAALGTPKPLDQFDWNHPAEIDRSLYEHLHQTLDFLRTGENVLFRGAAGLGKTMLSRHLGLRALELGYSVRFSSISAALADLLRQESIPATERRLKRYTMPSLLILDELGYLACDSRAADMLFHIVTARHHRRSVVITTNLAYKQWASVFPGATCLSALVDRFAQHCHTFDVKGESWRDHEAQTRLAKKRPTRT